MRLEFLLSGETSNVIFREPSLGFGTRRFGVYNPRDTQRSRKAMTPASVTT